MTVDVRPSRAATAWVERARVLQPRIRAEADAMEADRRISTALNDELTAQGFYRLLQPKRFGGFEETLATYAETMTEIARADGALGWVLTLNGAHAWWVANLPEAGQVEVFGADGDVRAPLILAPTGTAVRDGESFRVTGAWDYGSGVHVSNWIGLHAVVPPTDGGLPTETRLCFIPTTEIELEDNWFPLGMRATGSVRVHARGVLVPEHRTLDYVAASRTFSTPGARLHANPLFSLPGNCVFMVELASIAVGLATAALDAFVTRAASKRHSFPPFGLLAEAHRVQVRAGEAVAHRDTARIALLGLATRIEARGRSAAWDPGELASEVRRDLLVVDQIVAMCRAAVDHLVAVAGSSALGDGSVLQRIVRDMSQLGTHFLLERDRTTEIVGAVVLGQPAAGLL